MADSPDKLEGLGAAVANALGEGPCGEHLQIQKKRFLRRFAARSAVKHRWKALVPAAVGTALIAAFVCPFLLGPADAFSFWIGDAPNAGQPGAAFQAPAGQQLTIRFADHSLLRLEGDCAGRILESHDDRVRIALRRGTLHATIESQGEREWIVEAGAYRVTVLGTVFTVLWHPRRRVFEVDVLRGRVSVVGPTLQPTERVLHAGDRLHIDNRTEESTSHTAGDDAALVTSVTQEPVESAPSPPPARVRSRPARQPVAISERADAMASQYRANLQMSTCEVVRCATDFLLAQQVTAQQQQVGWSWVVHGEAAARPADNLGGLISLSLLDAHGATDDPRILQAVRHYADSMLTRMAKSPSELPYKPDIELLVRLSLLLQEPSYQEAADELFQRTLSRSPDGRAEVARIAAGRAREIAILGFDVALVIRAALAVRDRPYAYQLADELIRRSASWYHMIEDPRFAMISAAALVPTLERLDEAHYRRVIARFRSDLLSLQRSNGAFLINETQATAYAVLALLPSPLPGEREAAERGVRWLQSTMLRRGAFALFNDYMPEPFVGELVSEVNAEVLSAMAAHCGQHFR